MSEASIRGRAGSAVRNARERLFEGRSPLQQIVIAVSLFAGVALLAGGIFAPNSTASDLLTILFADSTLAATLRLSVPIAFAALGGIFAEKSGVINIGL